MQYATTLFIMPEGSTYNKYIRKSGINYAHSSDSTYRLLGCQWPLIKVSLCLKVIHCGVVSLYVGTYMCAVCAHVTTHCREF